MNGENGREKEPFDGRFWIVSGKGVGMRDLWQAYRFGLFERVEWERGTSFGKRTIDRES